MTDAERLAERVRTALPHVKSGTLRFWGQWFGRPLDNVHTVVDCAAEGAVIRFVFDQNEALSVSNPSKARIDAKTFCIGDASSVRWEWFFYGRAQTPENLYFEEYVWSPDGVSARTNVDWYNPDLRPNPRSPAVEIV